MASSKVKYLLVENKRLQSLVAKLAGTIETIHSQLEQKENALAKRRIEVATLQQACAKYKSRARIAPVQRTLPTDTVCLRCTKAKDVFGELKEAVDAFAEKLNAALADKEAQCSAQREKDDEIGKLRAALDERDRRDEERRQRIERQNVDERERSRKDYVDTIKEMAEMKARNQRTLELKFLEIEEQRRQNLRRYEQRLVVIQRQRTGVADAA